MLLLQMGWDTSIIDDHSYVTHASPLALSLYAYIITTSNMIITSSLQMLDHLILLLFIGLDDTKSVILDIDVCRRDVTDAGERSRRGGREIRKEMNNN